MEGLYDFGHIQIAQEEIKCILDSINYDTGKNKG
jgi:hypothetical protein